VHKGHYLFASVCTGGAIERVLRQDYGAFAYVEGGEVQPIEPASGAQALIMGLGMQLALSRVLSSGFRCTLLDEPTADLCDELALTLTSALACLGQQILMVSHREFDGVARLKR
jgi:DNA repair exonuclease SbcCD ATPase subunit